jgi:hypothetical protein
MRLFLAFAFSLTAMTAAAANGDAFWAARAEGASGGRAALAPIDAAIAAYERELAAKPADPETTWKLLRAYRFKAAYAVTDRDAKRAIYAEAKRRGAAARAAIDAQLLRSGVNPGRSPEKGVAAALRPIPHAAAVYYWDAVIWGEWALVYGKLAAAREGAADHIRRSSTIVMLADPSLEQGGGARVLGRLHDQTPRIPLITGWASQPLAVKYLREALAQGADDKLTMVFLAEALVGLDSKNRTEARAILEKVISTPGDPRFAVEEAAAVDDARALLAKLR